MRHAFVIAPLFALVFNAQGCEDDPPPAPTTTTARPSRPGTASAVPGGPTANRGDGGPPPLALPNGEQAFVESGVVRDPFRNYTREIVTPIATSDTDERLVTLSQFSLDDLRLMAIVLGTDSPYAMVKDPTGRGTILRRGMYVGRREVVQNRETGQQHTVHWRVARVLPARLRRMADGQLDEQPAEVVFERADPSNRTAQLVERSLALGVGASGAEVPTSTTALPSSVNVPGVGGNAPAFLPGALGAPPSAAGGRAGGVTPAPTTTTTVIVQTPQAPPAQPREVPLSTTPPPVRVTGDESPLSNR